MKMEHLTIQRLHRSGDISFSMSKVAYEIASPRISFVAVLQKFNKVTRIYRKGLKVRIPVAKVHASSHSRERVAN